MKRFDPHDWKPGFYQTPEELNTALDHLGVKGKEIADVHVIGLALNLSPENSRDIVRRTLARVGVPYEDIDSGRYPAGTTLLPREVEICEPVVILFSDGSTLELMPRAAEGMLMSTNQIPFEITIGTNCGNFASSEFFKCLRGRMIKGIQTIKRKVARSGSSSSYQEIREHIRFQFTLEGADDSCNCGFFFHQLYWHGWKGWFTFGVTSQDHHAELGYETASVPFSFIQSVSKPVRQVVICEGRGDGGAFSILPVALSPSEPRGMKMLHQEEISIYEDDLFTFLFYFLDQYFDDSFPYETLRDPWEGPRFEWYSDYNLYTYDTVRRMLLDVEKCADLLEQDYDDPRLDGLKERFKWYAFDPDEDKWKKRPTEREAARIIRSNIRLAADFYRRFVWKMRRMMESSPQFDLISFMGP